MKDCHVHTTISHDGISTFLEYADIAKEKGIDEITFTDHWDYYDDIDSDEMTTDVGYYYDKFLECQSMSEVKLNFGIEMGLQPDIVDIVREVVKKYPFDFIIGSSHIVCKKDIAWDNSFFEEITREEVYMKYFMESLENIKLYDDFDVYGHIDYVVRYGGYLKKRIDYDEFKDILDEILKTIIRKDKGIEINTSGIRYGMGSPHPNEDIIKRYRELGGEIITVGSDAHKADDLGKDFDVALDILEDSGFNEIAFYHEREPEFIKIKKLKNM